MNNDYMERYEPIFRLLFNISIIFKGLHALIEIIGGILFFFVTKSQIRYWVLLLTQEELIEDPHDLFANFFMHTASTLTINTQQFIGWYLLIHGIVNVIPIYGLLKRQLWAYPTAMVILSSFVIYQLVRYYYIPSPWLIVFSVIDGFVIYLVFHEYRYLRRYFRLYG